MSRRITTNDPYDIYSKNYRALDRVNDHFTEDIDYLTDCGLPVVQPDTMDYDFRDYIQTIEEIAQQNEKENNQ